MRWRICTASPSTSPAYVQSGNATLPSSMVQYAPFSPYARPVVLCSNATLPLSMARYMTMVPCAPCASLSSLRRALVGQSHHLSAHRPRLYLHHPALILCRRLWCTVCHVQYLCKPLCMKDSLCQPIDLANTCINQQCYFAFVYGAMCVMYKTCSSPCA